jgi:arylsulfatase A-like enzyme
MLSPNILFLTIDALRADRMGFQGYEKNTTPVLDGIIKNSRWCKNLFCLAGSTEPSFPSIFTSSRPLSYGGYDRGIVGRPDSLPEELNKAGYETIHLLTFPWVRSTYGYERGVDRVEHYYSVRRIVSNVLATIRNTVFAYKEGSLDFNVLIESTEAAVHSGLKDVITYCDIRKKQDAIERSFFRNASFVNEEFDLKRVKNLAKAHLHEFSLSSTEYIKKHLLNAELTQAGWLSADIKYLRSIGKNIGQCMDYALKSFSWLIGEPRLGLRYLRHKAFVDASDLTDRIISLLKEPRTKPFYIWTHFLDTHYPYMAGRLPNWIDNNRRYLRDVGHPEISRSDYLHVNTQPRNQSETMVWRHLYDAAVRYLDEHIGRILNALEETGQAGNTLVVIAGDHGEELGEHGDYSHRFRMYDENVHTQLIISHPDFQETRIDVLTDLRDLAPSILDFAGLPIPETWEGKPITQVSDREREYILMECFCRGNCLFSHRPVYMGVRTKRYKFIWKEWIDPSDKSSKEKVELYDLGKDKKEQKNIYSAGHPVAKQFYEIIADRMRDIPEIVASRGEAKLKSLS